jgi:transcription termination factor Rho
MQANTQEPDVRDPDYVIKYMSINNIETDDGDYVAKDVDAETLKWFYPEQYASMEEISDLDQYTSRFFDLACNYLESYTKDIASTQDAKIDYWAR